LEAHLEAHLEARLPSGKMFEIDMGIRKHAFAEGEFYHIYNRGVEKKPIFTQQKDVDRFFKSILEFNNITPIGSIYENSFVKESSIYRPLVRFVAYCLNPNHYHFILEPIVNKGIEKFMQRLGTGYTKYFNRRYKRSGVLFQGKFKSSHIDSNEYLLHVSAYVNLNNKVHQLGSQASKLVRSSWNEYVDPARQGICDKRIILDQFSTANQYVEFANSSLPQIIERKNSLKEIQSLLID